MKHLLKFSVTLFFAACLIVVTSCGGGTQTATLPDNTTFKYHTPKYVFYFIGDGMALPQVRMAEAAFNDDSFRKEYEKVTGTTLNREDLSIRQFTEAGMATNFAENRFITCSAAAATALATGHKTTINTVSMNGDRTESLPTIAEKAKANGKKVGILSSVSLDHATPACFYAHTPDRNQFESIGEFLLSSGFDYFAGGFLRHDTYRNKSLDDYLKAAADSGYSFVENRDAFDALSSSSGKVIATIGNMRKHNGDDMAIPYSIDIDLHQSADERISLADFVKKGIDILDNDEGFFMMIEGGKIDWVGHANDVVSNIYEVIALDDAITVALDFYKQHPEETLIVITGDHETGGLSLGFAGTNYETSFDRLVGQNISFKEFGNIVNDWKEDSSMNFDKALEIIESYFGLGNASLGLELSDYEKERLNAAYKLSVATTRQRLNEQDRVAYGSYDPLTVTITHILANKAGIDWTSFAHTGLPMPVFALGEGSRLFSGYYDNTDIPKRIAQIAGYGEL